MNVLQSQMAGLSRRHFLIGVTATAGAALAVTGWWMREAAAPLAGLPATICLSPQEAAVVHAVAEAVLPPPGGAFPDIGQACVVKRFDEELYFVNEDVQSDVRAALKLLEVLPLLYGHARPIMRLGLAQRREALEKAFQSRVEVVRAASSSLRLVVAFFYYAHPSTWAATGFDGTFSKIAPQMSEQRQFYARLKGAPP